MLEALVAGAGPAGTTAALLLARAGKAVMAKLLSVIGTALAIMAGPVVASLLEHQLLPHAQYYGSFQLRGSVALNGDFRLRGSIR